jgi:hypothetical protein
MNYYAIKTDPLLKKEEKRRYLISTKEGSKLGCLGTCYTRYLRLA